MKVDVPYRYFIQYRPYRMKLMRTAPAEAACTVEIPEAEAADAPVVMLVANPDREPGGVGYKGERFKAMGDGSPREIRMIGGRHYVERGPWQEFEEAVRDGRAADTFLGEQGAGFKGKPSTTLEDIYRAGRERGSEGHVVEHRDDGGEAVAKELQRMASMMLVVDGRVFEFTPEPILKYGRSLGCHVAPRPSRISWHEFYDRDFWYAGDECRENLLRPEHAEAVRDRRRGMAAFEVLDPEACAFDGATWDLVRTAEAACAHLAENTGGLPLDMLETYVSLRDELAVAGGRATGGVLAALAALAGPEPAEDGHAAALAAYHASRGFGTDARRQGAFYGHRPVATRRQEYLQKGSRNKWKAHASAALARWAARPAEDHWTHGAGPEAEAMGLKARGLLSRGQVVQACRNAGVAPGPLLAAAARGHAVFSSGEHLETGRCGSIVTVSPDGSIAAWHGPEGGDAPVRAAVSAAFAAEPETAIEAGLYGPAR